jgi:hypothetical protein
MQSSTSLASISSTTSSNSSIYGSQTILDAKDLHLAAPRCRSSIVTFLDNDQNILSPPPSRPPVRRQTQLRSTNKATPKCRHFIRTCIPSTPPFTLSNQTKPSDGIMRKQLFTKLCHNHRLLLVLNDYTCQCGCHFIMKKGTFVIHYEKFNDASPMKNRRLVTVISNELVCSKVPLEYLCNVDILRERVRTRHLYNDDEQSFDL